MRYMPNDQAPDSLSPEMLEQLMLAAQPEEQAQEEAQRANKNEKLHDGLTDDQLIELADRLIDDALEQCGDPMLHKIMAMRIISKLIYWHTEMGVGLISKSGGDEGSKHFEMGVGWLRDAGKLQGAGSLLQEVSIGPNDFVANAIYGDD